MPASGPNALPPAYTANSTETLQSANHPTLHENLSLEDRALWTKLGYGSASTPVRAKGLVGKGADGDSIWDTLARRNKVINGAMRVKQRSTLGSTDNSYTLDRWRVLMESANACVVTQETSNVPSYGSKRAAKLTVGSANNNKFGLFTPLEFLDVADLRGKLVSLQASLEATAGISDVRMAVLEFTGTADAVSGDPISSWNAAGTNPTLAANWAYLGTPVNLSVGTSDAIKYVEGLTVGASMNNLAVFIWSDDKTTTTTTDFMIVTDVQLEEGAVCTSFDRVPLALDEIECWRWLYVYSSEAIGLAYSNTILATDNTTQPPVPMRAAPTISGASFSVNSGSAGTVAAVALSRRNLRFYNSDSNWTVTALVSLTAIVSAEL